MATGNTAAIVSPESQQSIIKYSEGIFSALGNNFNFRSKLLDQDRSYAREQDYTEAKRRAEAARATGDTSKIGSVTLPVVGPQVDSATAFFVEMFLTSYPLFPIVSQPSAIDVGLQLETIIAQSAVQYQWARHLAMCFRDGLKYNIHAAEIDWCREKVPSIKSDVSQQVELGVPQELYFEGNRLKRLDPYNLIFDSRVPIAESHQRGEFAGYTELITRMELKQLFLNLDNKLTMNATRAFASGMAMSTSTLSTTGAYYVPPVNPQSFIDPNFNSQNWLQWANLDTKRRIQYSDMYEKTVLYGRIIPREHGIAAKSDGVNAGDPQIYKFIIINRKVVIYVQRMTNAHAMLPIVVGQLNEDGLNLQTKSYADNAAPYQHLASALYNSAIASQRRKVYDRLIYDPSRINKADIDKVDPVARIPVKTEAYGKPLSESVYQIPFRDEGVAQILSMGREVVSMADISTGSNRVQQGQFQKGNKTRYEVEQVVSNSDARPKTSAILLGTSWLHPIKEMIKYNILQYQPPTDLFNHAQKKPVTIKPNELRKVSWEFQMADGVMPSERFVDFQLFGQMLQYATSNPAAAAEYDLTGMFVYQLKSQGARWVDDFKRTPEQQTQFMAQMQAAQQGAPANAAV
jgi:hypothetical protein